MQKYYFSRLCLMAVACLFCVLNVQAYDKKYQKKIDKEIERVFDGAISISETISNITDSCTKTTSEFHRLRSEGSSIGYLCITQGKGRFETFDFLIIYDLQKQIKGLKILQYRSSYGYEIGARSWLKQFYNHNIQYTYKHNDNVQAMSGATVSSKGIIEAINRANQQLMHLKQ
jgi:Na+-translocating ferredoxin:NAD+ oxidoreductase RnfG subunit